MRTIVVLLALGLAAIEAVPSSPQRIVGGTQTEISSYPNLASLLYSDNFVSYSNRCAGSIINTRAILTAAHCVSGDPALRWRVRVGSSLANSGGVVHNVDRVVTHSAHNFAVRNNNDIAILGTTTFLTLNNNVRLSLLAGTNYNLPDNAQVWIAGWGVTSLGGSKPEHLRHASILTVNQETCRSTYAEAGSTVLADSMVCAGSFNLGGSGPCEGDSGGPLLHQGVVVGIISWGRGCGTTRFPGVYTRVSNYRNWITSNA